MDKPAITEVSKNLQKATAANAPANTILAILNDLKANLQATEDLLRSTKIGVIVNRSKQHTDPAVARLASEIVKKWRDDIQKQKGTASPKPSGTASPVPTSKENGNGDKKSSGAKDVPPDQRDFRKDKVDIACTNQATRDSCIGLIYNGLAYMSTLPSSTILAKATEIEAAGFASIGPETNPAYSSKFRSLFQNLKNKGSSGLRARVLSGEISPEKFVKMTPEELKSKERREEDKRLHKENMKDAQVPQMERSISSAIQCKNPKCGKNTVAYSQAQTRRLVFSLLSRGFSTARPLEWNEMLTLSPRTVLMSR